MSNADLFERIAIVGMAGRFPGAPDLEAFWRNLRAGVESVTFFSQAELAAAGVDADLRQAPNYVPAGAVLDGVERFDADFFGFTPREAEITDPQHRLFLECSWQALEHSGYAPGASAQRTAVFAGAGMSTYLLRNLAPNRNRLATVTDFQLSLGNNKDYVPTRVAYKLNLTGPSVNVNTACSTSLVAVHLGCQSLLDYHCDMALAGGVGIQTPQIQGYLYEPGGINSPDGHCRAFDARAGGTVSGNGVGVVVLKRLPDALAAGDTIHAVILGSAINNDGAAKVGFTAPSVDGQAAVIAEALAVAEVDPETITYIETHGTGTELGDPIEIEALTQAFRAKTQRTGFCALGSVKTNIGHLDEAAGVAGLIKTVLALQHQQLPPSLHFTKPNPSIDFKGSPFFVNSTLADWKSDGQPRRAGVSSFGIGGTNAHVVLEEAPPPQPAAAARRWQLLLLSARTETALETATSNLAAQLQTTPQLELADLAYTLTVGRKAFDHRRAVVCSDVGQALAALRERDPQHMYSGHTARGQRSLAFMFPGQGAQYVNMGIGLYQTEPIFRETVDRCCELLTRDLGLDLRQIMYAQEAQPAAEQLAQTALAQPALFVTEYALAQLWLAWGLQPQALIGHSLGEYVAACLAEVFTLEDALLLVAARGRLMQALPSGAMLAVAMSAEALEPLLGLRLSLAAINGSNQCVASGPEQAIAKLQDQLKHQDVACRRLPTSHAFHSELMAPVLQPFTEQAARITLCPPQIPFVSNVSGTWITATQTTDPEYWAAHLRQTVRFADGLNCLLEEPDRLLLEVGPGRTLTGLAARHPARTEQQVVINSLPLPQTRQSDPAYMLATAGKLWLAGAALDYARAFANERRQRLPLPSYPFERNRYWIDAPAAVVAEPQVPNIEDWFYVPRWQRVPLPTQPAPFDPAANGNTQGSVFGRATADAACWLLFTNEHGLGTTLAERLRAEGKPVFEVQAGEQFVRMDATTFCIDPGQRADYAALLQALHEQGSQPAHIVHLWSVTPAAPDAFVQVQAVGFYSLLYLAQAWGARGSPEGLQLTVVSNNMQAAPAADLHCPEKATLLGPLRVIPQEYPNIRCRSIDLAWPDSGAWETEAHVDSLLAELNTDAPENMVVYRAGVRWTPSIEPLRLPAAASNGLSQLRADGVYLITGGLGSMGLAFARYLAQHSRARLALLHHTEFPAREMWATWPADADSAQRAQLHLDLPAALDRLAQQEAARAQALPFNSLRQHDGLEEKLNTYCASLAYEYLMSSDLPAGAGTVHKRRTLRARLGVLPKFEKFIEFFLRVLAEDGFVRNGGAQLEFLGASPPAAQQLHAEMTQQYPQFAGLLDLLAYCAANYQPALSGEIEAISVLYPDGTNTHLEESAQRSAEHTNDLLYLQLLADLLRDIGAGSDGRPLRILEVGGGSGGLTAQLLDVLAGHTVEYHFTDIGRSFVIQAEQEAARRGIDSMQFGLFDISRAPEQQGYRLGSFDVVLGYNVVHATPVIAESLANLKSILAPGGLLCLVETVQARRWDHMIWGLAEGWWYFEDADLRPHSPLLNLDQWEAALRAQGFQNVRSFPKPAAERVPTDAGLIVAQQTAAPKAKKIHAQIRKLQEIESRGAQVLLLHADVADSTQMQAAVTQTLDYFGELHGVIHTAGVLGQGLINDRQPEQVERVFAPKIHGAYALQTALQDVELDFMLYCASLSSLAPIIGQVDYSAANAFLDALAQQQAQQGLPVVSIDWGFWQELGMIEQAALPAEEKQRVVDEIEASGWSNAGVEAFARILAGTSAPQVLVSPHDICTDGQQPREAARALSMGAVSHPLLDELAAADGLATFTTRLQPSHYWVLDEHRLQGQAVLPGTAYLELARAAFAHHVRPGPVELREVYFLRPLAFAADEEKEVRTILKQNGADYDFFVVSRAAGERWQEHARGEIATLTLTPPERHNLTALAVDCAAEEIILDSDRPAAEMSVFEARVAQFSPHWRSLRRVGFGARQGLAELALPAEFAPEVEAYGLHPALLDVAGGFLAEHQVFEHGLPFSYTRVRVYAPLPAQIHSHVRLAAGERAGALTFDADILDGQGEVLVQVSGYTLREVVTEAAAPAVENFHLEIAVPGALETLAFRPAGRVVPNRGQVEIRVQAAGLNFIEVLYALGMLPDPPGGQAKFGLECAGTITTVGPGVEEFAPGDEVFAYAPASFSAYTTVAASAVAHKPANLTLEEAATLPAVYLTAYYALVARGRLRAGERVLIHAATGGVGMAAINIARWIGAEIFATAGNPEKRKYLHALGVEHVMDSRSLDFADEIMVRTQRRGVDVVLNSLGGEFIPASLKTLAPYGRFLELGKRDFFENRPLELGPFAQSLTFIAVDVGTDMPGFSSVWRELGAHLQEGHLPPLPHRVFPMTAAAEAFEFMAQAKHLGKIVLVLQDSDHPAVVTAVPVGAGRPLAEILNLTVPAVYSSLEPQAEPTMLSGADTAAPEATILPAHSRPALATEYIAPRNPVEQSVAEVWQALLGITQVGIHDNFFDLRGDSLLVAQVMSRLHAVFAIKLPLSSLFDGPTVAELAARIAAQQQPDSPLGEEEEEGEI